MKKRVTDCLLPSVLLGLPPDPVGDLLMSSRDLIPLRIAVEHPELLLGGQAGGDSEGKEEQSE